MMAFQGCRTACEFLFYFIFFFFRYGTIHLLWRVRVLLHPKDLYGIWNRCGDYTPAAFDCRQGNLSRDNEERTRERLLS